MDFAEKIKAFQQKALLEANRKVSLAVESLFTDVVVLTPSPANPGDYAQGHLVNQWMPEAGGTFSSDVNISTNPNGSDSLSRIKVLLTEQLFFGKDNIITLTNNVDYAYRAEYVGWPSGDSSTGWHWSGKVGPYKMVATAVNNFRGAYS